MITQGHNRNNWSSLMKFPQRTAVLLLNGTTHVLEDLPMSDVIQHDMILKYICWSKELDTIVIRTR